MRRFITEMGGEGGYTDSTTDGMPPRKKTGGAERRWGGFLFFFFSRFWEEESEVEEAQEWGIEEKRERKYIRGIGLDSERTVPSLFYPFFLRSSVPLRRTNRGKGGRDGGNLLRRKGILYQ
jgi:hypothetical protein